MKKIILILALVLLVLITSCTEQIEKTEETEDTEDTEDTIRGVDLTDIDSKTIKEKVEILKENLYTEGSGNEAKKYFPDLVRVFLNQNNPKYSAKVLPFIYYYSKEADITISISNLDFTVFICPGRLDNLLPESKYNQCDIADEYLHP